MNVMRELASNIMNQSPLGSCLMTLVNTPQGIAVGVKVTPEQVNPYLWYTNAGERWDLAEGVQEDLRGALEAVGLTVYTNQLLWEQVIANEEALYQGLFIEPTNSPQDEGNIVYMSW